MLFKLFVELNKFHYKKKPYKPLNPECETYNSSTANFVCWSCCLTFPMFADKFSHPEPISASIQTFLEQR